jgi:outer membrane receptor protein involved in Fe transport
MNKSILIGFFVILALPVSALALGNPLGEHAELRLDTSKVVDLDEIIVVSQPKEQVLLRQQPLSSSVFTNRELRQLNVRDLSQLSAFVPSFVMPSYGSRLTSSMYVRGIGSRAGSPAVGVYYDNLPLLGKTAINNHYYMLDRVDVLRGPQGTLYGMNTEGGLVRIYSKNPMNYQGTDIALGAGTGFYRNVEVAHYHRPSANFAFSVAGFYSGQNGFFRNQNTGDRADLTDEAGSKIRLMWKPNSRLTFDLTSDYQFVTQNAFPYGAYDNVTGNTAEPSTTFTNTYKRQMVNTGLTIGYDMGSLLFTSTTSHQYLWDRMLMDQDYMPTDFMSLSQLQKMNGITQEITLRNKQESAWRHATGIFFSHQWLRTDAAVGFGDDMNRFISKNVYDLAYWGMFNAMVARMVNAGTPQAVAEQTVKNTIERAGGVNIDINMGAAPSLFRTPQTNFAVYHESNFDLTERLVATLGLRYDYNRVSVDYLSKGTMKLNESVMGQNVNANLSSLLSNSVSDTHHQLLPKFALTYHIDDNNSNIYVTVAKGFRAGGYNIQMFSDILQTEFSAASKSIRESGDVPLTHTAADYDNVNNTISYKPETSWNYEAGTHLNLFGGKLHADFSVFYMQIHNQQLSVMAGQYGYGRMMVNAGKSSSCGLELALRGSALDNQISWALSYSFTHSTFRQYTDSISVNGAKQAVDYKGNNVPFVPQHTFSALADYRFGLCRDGFLKAVTLGVNVNGNGKTYWDIDNTLSQKLYAVLGAHVNFDFGCCSLDIWGRNLTNTKYNTFLVSNTFGNTVSSFAQQGNPVQIGADVRFHF